MTPAGLPHSEISGSKAVCASPKLIAACHVLHRFPEPRHPPCALSCLTSISGFPQKKTGMQHGTHAAEYTPQLPPVRRPTSHRRGHPRLHFFPIRLSKIRRPITQSHTGHQSFRPSPAMLSNAMRLSGGAPGEPKSPPVNAGTKPATTAKLQPPLRHPTPQSASANPPKSFAAFPSRAPEPPAASPPCSNPRPNRANGRRNHRRMFPSFCVVAAKRSKFGDTKPGVW